LKDAVLLAQNGHLTPPPSSDLTQGFAVEMPSFVSDCVEQVTPAQSIPFCTPSSNPDTRHFPDPVEQDAITQNVSFMHFI
jgi:hypothetical protein